MNSLVFLIPLSILLLVGAGIALLWAVDHGQFDDLETAELLPVIDADAAASEAAPGEESVDSAEDTRGSR